MKKVFLIILILFLIPFCLAEQQKVIFTQITFYNSERSPQIDSVLLLEGYPSLSGEGEFVLNLFDESDNQLFSTRFAIVFEFSGIPEELTSVSQKFFIPYHENSKLVLTKNGVVLFERQLDSLLCNNNSKCEPNENFASCPTDCLIDSKDGYCNPKTDSVCDPDCYEGVDYDCYLKKVEKKEEDKNKNLVPNQKESDTNLLAVFSKDASSQNGSIIFPLLLLVIIIIVLGIFFIIMKKYK
jgi:hypothetical protein